jgi:hypothetical protein
MNRRSFLFGAAGASGLLLPARAEACRLGRRRQAAGAPCGSSDADVGELGSDTVGVQDLGTFSFWYYGNHPDNPAYNWPHRYLGVTGTAPNYNKANLYVPSHRNNPYLHWTFHGTVTNGHFWGVIRNKYTREYLRGVGEEVVTSKTEVAGCLWAVLRFNSRTRLSVSNLIEGPAVKPNLTPVGTSTRPVVTTDDDRLRYTIDKWAVKRLGP